MNFNIIEIKHDNPTFALQTGILVKETEHILYVYLHNRLYAYVKMKQSRGKIINLKRK